MQAASRQTSQSGRHERSKWQVLFSRRSPGMLYQALCARWQLRRCDVVPYTVRVHGRVHVAKHGGRIEVGDRVRFEARTVPVEMVALRGATLRIGAGTFINYGVSLSAHSLVSIGANCMIGNYVIIMDGDYHDVYDKTLPGKVSPVVIEDDVWVGVRAIVLKGVRVGRGSVIGAGSVVTTDIPPNSVAFGVPAKVIRTLDRLNIPLEEMLPEVDPRIMQDMSLALTDLEQADAEP